MPCRMLVPCLVVVLTGCLPSLDDECSDVAPCPADRVCIGGVCTPLAAGGDGAMVSDGSPPGDGRPADGAPPDARPTDAITVDADRSDGAPDGASDAEPMDAAVDHSLPDASSMDVGVVEPPPDAEVDAEPDLAPGCDPQPGGCNGEDDDCDGRTDEEDEARAGCDEPFGAIVTCADAECAYACPEGSDPGREGPERGCPRFCDVLDPGWIVVADGFEKSSQPEQQVALAAVGDRRFVAVYDIDAADDQRIVRTFEFPVDAVDDADVEQVRLGQTRGALGPDAVYVGLSATAIADRFVVGAWQFRDDDANDIVEILERAADGSRRQRQLAARWPQPPSMTVGLDGDTMVTFVESLDRDADPPVGEVYVDRWPANVRGGNAQLQQRIVPQRPVGLAHDVAFTTANGYGLLTDVFDYDRNGDEVYALRDHRFDATPAPVADALLSLAGPAIDRLSVAGPPGARFAVVAIDDAEEFAFVPLEEDAPGFGEPAFENWHHGPPVGLRGVGLPGGPGVVYRGGEAVRIVLTAPEGRLDERGDLLGPREKVRAVDARVAADGRTLEVVVLREERGTGIVAFARHVCF